MTVLLISGMRHGRLLDSELGTRNSEPGLKNIVRWIIPLALLLATTAWAIDESELLPVEEAFALTVTADGPDSLKVHWEIADGYYLYRHRTSFESATPGVSLGEPIMPAGEEKEDEFFGRVQTWRHGIDISIPLAERDPSVTTLDLTVKSQGCADLGVCYPPQRRTVQVSLPPARSAPELGGLNLGGTTTGGVFGQQALPVDEAFRFEAIAMSPTELLARWTIADGYYLYRDKIELALGAEAPARVEAIQLPPGEPMVDEHFGDVEVYYGQVEVPVQLARTGGEAGDVLLTGLYQGCKEAGICYPPTERQIPVALPAFAGPLAGAVAAAPTPQEVTAQILPEQDRLARALSDDAWWTLLTFFGFGLLLAFTPCVFPMIPILSGIIAGQGDQISTLKAFWLSLVYVLAMALTYTIAGVIAGYWGYNLQAAFQNPWVLGSFSLVFVLLALAMFGFYELQLPASLQTRLNSISNRQSGGTLLGTAIMGFLSALIVGPCVAPPLAAALIYIGQTGDPVLGGAALFFLSLGMGAPLLVIGTSAGKLLPRAGGWMDAVKAVFGVGLLALAIWMLERIAPPALIMLLWGALAIASGVYLGAFERIPDGASGWRKLWKALGVLLVMLGALELVGAAAGGRDWMQPLRGIAVGGGGPQTTQGVAFVKVKSLADVESTLAAAGSPGMLDFYADWCVDCKRMDKYTFPEAPVVAALSSGVSMKADVTANDDVDQALMQHFSIIGPPATLFFDAEGREMPQFRVVGYMKPDAFAAHVERAYQAGGR